MLTARSRRGFTIWESLASLTVLISLLALGAHYVHQRQEALRNKHTADDLRQVTENIQRYAQKNQTKVIKLLDETQNKQKLNFVNLSPMLSPELRQQLKVKNSYGQEYATYVYVPLDKSTHPTVAPSSDHEYPDTLYLLIITTEGHKIANSSLPQIARILGRQALYILDNPAKNVTNPDSTRLQEKACGISISQLPEKLLSKLAPGHLASNILLYPNDLMNIQNMLHRIPSSNNILNSMETDLFMLEHAIKFSQNSASATSTDTSTATISAKEMLLKNVDSTIRLSCEKGAKIEVGNRKSGEAVIISPDKVTAVTKKLPEPWQTYINRHSGPELHAHWNKVPYYELKDMKEQQDFANLLCKSLPQSSHPEPDQSLGRLFMLGDAPTASGALYLCLNATEAVTIWNHREETQSTKPEKQDSKEKRSWMQPFGKSKE